METILSISDSGFTEKGEYKDNQGYDGYVVVTDQQTIKFGVDNDGNCCENWGYLASEDDLQYFVGAELLSVEVVNEALEKTKVDVYDGCAMFVNINTSRGLLQLTVYNEHNGYYSHEAVVISRDVNERGYI